MPAAVAQATTPLVQISRELAARVDQLRFGPPVDTVYDPLGYARAPHERYLERWGRGPKPCVLLGMNPGPYGMAQTGVPFGEVAAARDWLGVAAPVGKPPHEHPKRPVVGFSCLRSEVSGKRIWGWAQARFGTPERFFARFFVANYCPLVFMDAAGRNVTPDKLAPKERAALELACDEALRATMELLGVELVVGVGGYARKRCERALAGLGVRIGSIPHPSPANPAANRGWAEQAERALRELGVEL